MSNATKIAALESLLARIKHNVALPRVNGSLPTFAASAPVASAPAAALEAMNDELDDLLDAPVLEVAASAVPGEAVAARAPMETFAGDDIFDDDEIIELDEDDGIEIIEESVEITEEDEEQYISDEEDFDVAVSPEPPPVEQSTQPSYAEVDPVFDELDDLDVSPSPAISPTFEPQAATASATTGAEDSSVGMRAPAFESEAPVASSVELSPAGARSADAFDDLDFDDDAEADVSSVQPAVKRDAEYPARSSVQASSPADVAGGASDIVFDLVDPSPEPPASSPRQRPPESMDEALQSAAEQMSPLTPPPESGAQPASQRDAMDQDLLEEALLRESSVGHEVPERLDDDLGDDIDDLLDAEVEIPTFKQRGRPEMPTMEQLGQTVDLEAPLGGAEQLELDPLASAEVAQSQGSRVIVTPVAPVDDLEMSLPSRPSGTFDINLKPPPEVGAEFAELRAKQAVREERHSAPPVARVEQTEPLPEVSDIAEPLPAQMQAAVAAGDSPTKLERAPVVASDLVVERTEPSATPQTQSFANWLDASLELLSK